MAAGFYYVGSALHIDPMIFSRISPYTGLTRRMDDSIAIPRHGDQLIQFGNVAGNREYAMRLQVLRRTALKGDNLMAKL